MSLEVLYQDQFYVAVNKPAGLLVHRTKLDIKESQAVVQILRDQLKQKVFPVHRLDRPTSGVLVIALSSEAAQKLASQFESQTIIKKYLAIVRGQFKHEVFLDHPLKQEMKIDSGTQAAQTFFKPLATVEIKSAIDRYPTSRFSLVEAVPKTGRTHQIRKHLKHLNHPIIGDVNHGNGKYNKFFSEQLGVSGLLLCCSQISFRHPFTSEDVTISADLPEAFSKAIHQLGLNYDPTA